MLQDPASPIAASLRAYIKDQSAPAPTAQKSGTPPGVPLPTSVVTALTQLLVLPTRGASSSSMQMHHEGGDGKGAVLQAQQGQSSTEAADGGMAIAQAVDVMVDAAHCLATTVYPSPGMVWPFVCTDCVCMLWLACSPPCEQCLQGRSIN